MVGCSRWDYQRSLTWHKNLPPLDPFHNIDPLLDGNTAERQQLQAISGPTLAEKQIGYSQIVDDDSDDSVWERSAFDAFNKMDEYETKVFSLKISTVLYTVYSTL